LHRAHHLGTNDLQRLFSADFAGNIQRRSPEQDGIGAERDGFHHIGTSANAAIDLCRSQIKSGHTGDAVRRGPGGKEYALPS
jgi:hypothetical protein